MSPPGPGSGIESTTAGHSARERRSMSEVTHLGDGSTKTVDSSNLSTSFDRISCGFLGLKQEDSILRDSCQLLPSVLLIH